MDANASKSDYRRMLDSAMGKIKQMKDSEKRLIHKTRELASDPPLEQEMAYVKPIKNGVRKIVNGPAAGPDLANKSEAGGVSDPEPVPSPPFRNVMVKLDGGFHDALMEKYEAQKPEFDGEKYVGDGTPYKGAFIGSMTRRIFEKALELKDKLDFSEQEKEVCKREVEYLEKKKSTADRHMLLWGIGIGVVVVSALGLIFWFVLRPSTD